MKKFISLILVLALLFSLMSVAAFAEGDSISIAFSSPHIDDQIVTNALKSCVSSSTHDIIVDSAKLYDEEKLAEIRSIGSFDAFRNFWNNKDNTVTDTEYAAKKYVAVFYIYIDDPSPTASTKVVFENNTGATWDWNTLDNSTLYCYFEFQPTRNPASEGDSHAVYAIYQEAEESGTIYSVDIDFGDMKFTYTAPSKGTWDPESGEYDGATGAQWISDTNGITVTNKSNAPITAEFQYESLDGFDSVTGAFLNEAKSESVTDPVPLKRADDPNAEGTTSTTVFLNLTGELPSTAKEETRCGTVTVVIDDP